MIVTIAWVAADRLVSGRGPDWSRTPARGGWRLSSLQSGLWRSSRLVSIWTLRASRSIVPLAHRALARLDETPPSDPSPDVPGLTCARDQSNRRRRPLRGPCPYRNLRQTSPLSRIGSIPARANQRPRPQQEQENGMSSSVPRDAIESTWSRFSGLILPVAIVGAVLVFVVPLPAGGPRPAAGGQHHAGGADPADGAGDRDAAGVQRLPDDPAGHHAEPAGPERGDDPANPDRRWRATAWTPRVG